MNFPELHDDVVKCAKRLLGCYIVREIDGKRLTGKIVETEAYHQNDAASHSYRGQTPRTKVMFGHPGFAYVYFTYGMHYCFNVVTGPTGEGSAVLIRALEPVKGIEQMQKHRGNKLAHELTNGPAKLCYALKIDKKFSGHDLRNLPLQLVAMPELPSNKIVTTTRIGISQAKDKPWRFYIKDNAWVSKK